MRLSRRSIAFTSAVLLAALTTSHLSWGGSPALANPFDETIKPLEIGDGMPAAAYVDQHGRPFYFSAVAGQTTLLGFIYTRCTDACPLITQKFGRLRDTLGAGPYHFVEATIDPAHDHVPQLAAYARKNGALADNWSLITGSDSAMTQLWRSAGVSVIDNGKGQLIHNDRLVLISGDGKMADVIDAVGWSPHEVAAQMRHVAGRASNPFARADLALTKIVAEFCGGSYRTASGLIDVTMAVLLLGLGAAIFYWLGRRLFAQGA